MKLQSKRNYVEKLNLNGTECVRKHFYSLDAWRSELNNHAVISEYTHTAPLCNAYPGITICDYLAHPHLLDVLEMQEQRGFDEKIWRTFAAWLKNAAQSGLLPAEGNLRNFLWNENAGEIIPVDLEHWQKIPFHESAAAIAAFLMEYYPPDSAVKRDACAVLCEMWGIGADAVSRKRSGLKSFRSLEKHPLKVSLILLAGGKSVRMGKNKAQLDFCGRTLLQHQMETAAMLGIDDILISGSIEDTGCSASVSDELPLRGPLGGIYSCMRRAKHEKCVVLGVDMPFVSAEILSELVVSHENSGCEITLAVHNGKFEPLAGVYNTSLAERIGMLIAEKGVSVRCLMEISTVNYVSFDQNPHMWHNCNTPDTYAALTNGELTQSILKNIQS